MKITRDLYAFVSVATFLGFSSKADGRLPAPGNLSHAWLDPFTVNVSWEKPGNLSEGCDVIYDFNVNEETANKIEQQTIHSSNTIRFLTEETDSDHWKVSVQAVGVQRCSGQRSRQESIVVKTGKPRAEVVKDFKCLIESNESNCSWVPVDPSLNTTLSYRLCGHTKKHLESLKECDHHYSDGIRRGCRLSTNCLHGDVCMILETDIGMKSFTLECAIAPPEMKISEDGDYLNLMWTPPHVGPTCGWIYQVSYEECGQLQPLLSSKMKINEASGHGPLKIAYNKYCSYKFKFNVSTDRTCTPIQSDGSGFQTYGTDKPYAQPLMSVILVAALLSILLSVSFILSCYCIRRHSAILCPIIPDPSAMFNEMMVNGSKELKASISLYTPVSEAIDPCKISLVNETSVSMENSLE